MNEDCDLARFAPFPLHLAAGWLHFSPSHIRLLVHCPTRPPFRAAADCLQPLSATPKRPVEAPRGRPRPANRRALASILERLPRQQLSPATDLFQRYCQDTTIETPVRSAKEN